MDGKDWLGLLLGLVAGYYLVAHYGTMGRPY